MTTDKTSGEWLPIETAPMGDDPKEDNGPPILIGRVGEWAYEGFWYAHWQCWMFANLDSEYGVDVYPTHWMPLPSPPLSNKDNTDATE